MNICKLFTTTTTMTMGITTTNLRQFRDSRKSADNLKNCKLSELFIYVSTFKVNVLKKSCNAQWYEIYKEVNQMIMFALNS